MPVQHTTDPSTDDDAVTAAASISRRRFLAIPVALAAAGLAGSLTARLASASSVLAAGTLHPEPRPGITAEKILAPDVLKSDKARKLYDLAREIPEVLDGIHCYCECDGAPMHHRSLLSCFESDQAEGCYACGAEARLVHRLHGEKKTLAEIRAAVDKKFG